MEITRQAQLDEVALAPQHLDSSPLYDFRVENNYLPVAGEGNPHAQIMLMGEAPGKWEAKSGRPFVGASGLVDSPVCSHSAPAD
jgi:DNA polymerase